MAQVKVSDLPSLSTLGQSDTVIVNQSGVTSRANASAFTEVKTSNYSTLAAAITAAANDTLIVDSSVTVSSDTTIASTVEVMFTRAGKLVPANGVTVTLNCPISAGLWQIFDTSSGGSFTLDQNIVGEVVPQWWGASPSASAATNTTAINNSLDSFTVASSAVSNVKWRLPPGSYSVNAAITMPTDDLKYARMEWDGEIVQTSATAHGIVFNDVYYSDIRNIRVSTTWDAWANSRAGVRFAGETGHNRISFNLVQNFERGVNFNAASLLTGYNQFYFQYIRDNKYGVYATPDGGATNWFNANSLYGGSFGNANKATTAGSTGIHISGASYGNRFYDQTMETLHIGYDIQSHTGWLISLPYFEDVDTALKLQTAVAGTLIWGYQEYDLQTIETDSGTRRNIITNIGKTSDNDPSVEVDWAAFRFRQNLGGDASKDPIADLKYFYAAARLALIDHFGEAVFLDKGFHTGASAPTSGTYNAGAVAWNTTAATAGNAMGFICTTAGTQGTLSGVTGSATSGAATLTVNSATNLKAGMFITVAGGAWTAGQILSISGTTVTMSTNSGATVTGQAVSYAAATFKALPNHA